jgi:hypothetical protein
MGSLARLAPVAKAPFFKKKSDLNTNSCLAASAASVLPHDENTAQTKLTRGAAARHRTGFQGLQAVNQTHVRVNAPNECGWK